MANQKPINAERRVAAASRDAGSRRGVMQGWNGPRQTTEQGAHDERVLTQRRAADLAANDWCAESMLSAFSHNVIGSGLRPSARIPADQLGITPEKALELDKRLEWLFWSWSRSADVRGAMSFGELQALGLRTMLSLGEMLHIPVMLSEEERESMGLRFALALQDVSPTRLRTPEALKQDPDVRDGIRFNRWGRPSEYFVACPKRDGDGLLTEMESVTEYVTMPASVGHRPGVFHIFARQDDEQIRGASIFANSINLFRLLDDSLANELETQVLSSKFSIFIQRDPTMSNVMPVGVQQDTVEAASPYTMIDGASVYYGAEGEKPEVIGNERPSQNVQSFWKMVENAIASSAGLPYIAVSKDFSEVNYSSARAAMNEAWRVYRWWRGFMADRYCQPIWEMLVEEAVLRGYVDIPLDRFYGERELWTACDWHGPARGYVDPTKEVQADILAVDNHLLTRHEAMAQAGRDFDDEFPILLAESEAMEKLSPAEFHPKKILGMTGGAAQSPQGGSASTQENDEEAGDRGDDTNEGENDD